MRTSVLRDRTGPVQGTDHSLHAPQLTSQQQFPNNLPQYVIDRREKARAFSEAAAQGPYHSLETSIAKLRGTEASLRLCADVIEGAVLALGVQTTHQLISCLNEAREDIHATEARFREAAQVTKEEKRLQVELLDSLIHSHNSLRDKNETAEREIRRLTEDRDKKDAAADHAIQYVHGVIAERAAWQERNGFNVLDLPREEASFSQQAVTALDALQHIRTLRLDSSSQEIAVAHPSLARHPQRTASGGTGTSLPATGGTGSFSAALPSRSTSILPTVSMPPRVGQSMAHHDTRSGEGKEISFARSLYPSAPPVSSAALVDARAAPRSLPDQDALLVTRYRGLANTRHSTVVPAARLHYVPPSEEVALLREVLAMGTGSSTLMADIVTARATLERHKQKLREECSAMRRAMSRVRQEVNGLRRYMQDLLSQGMPFLAMKEDLVQPIQRRVERDAREMAQLWIADMTIDVDAAATGRYATVNLGRLTDSPGIEEATPLTVTVSEGDTPETQGLRSPAGTPGILVGEKRTPPRSDGIPLVTTTATRASFVSLNSPALHVKSPWNTGHVVAAPRSVVAGEPEERAQSTTRTSFTSVGDMAFSPSPVDLTTFGVVGRGDANHSSEFETDHDSPHANGTTVAAASGAATAGN